MKGAARSLPCLGRGDDIAAATESEDRRVDALDFGEAVGLRQFEGLVL